MLETEITVDHITGLGSRTEHVNHDLFSQALNTMYATPLLKSLNIFQHREHLFELQQRLGNEVQLAYGFGDSPPHNLDYVEVEIPHRHDSTQLLFRLPSRFSELYQRSPVRVYAMISACAEMAAGYFVLTRDEQEEVMNGLREVGNSRQSLVSISSISEKCPLINSVSVDTMLDKWRRVLQGELCIKEG